MLRFTAFPTGLVGDAKCVATNQASDGHRDYKDALAREPDAAQVIPMGRMANLQDGRHDESAPHTPSAYPGPTSCEALAPRCGVGVPWGHLSLKRKIVLYWEAVHVGKKGEALRFTRSPHPGHPA